MHQMDPKISKVDSRVRNINDIEEFKKCEIERFQENVRLYFFIHRGLPMCAFDQETSVLCQSQ